MTLVEKIKNMCSERGETLASLERKMDFGNGTIRKWDNTIPSGDKLAKVANFFQVSVDYLLGKTSFKNMQDFLETPHDNSSSCDTKLLYGRTIKQIREDLNISAQKMSCDLALTEEDLINLESGLYPVRYKLAEKIASYLNIKLDEIYHSPYEPTNIDLKCNDDASQLHENNNHDVEVENDNNIKLLARHLEKIPGQQRTRLIENFHDAIDIYLDAIGIPKED